MNIKSIFSSISVVVLASLGACTSEQDLYQEGGTLNGTPLAISASMKGGAVKATDDYGPFAKNDDIYLYYGFQNLDDIYPWLQGKYTCVESDVTKEWKYDEKAADKSIYIEDIKSPNYNSKYYFTALSLPIPKEIGSDYYTVKADQRSAGYTASDFRIARAVYSDANTWKNSITLHFRHVLSRLNVELILPKGKTDQGYFDNPYLADMVSSAQILKRQIQYSVVFDSNKGDSQILEAGVNEKGTSSTIDMYKVSGDGIKTQTSGGVEAACHTFSCILPGQIMLGTSDNPLMKFVINGKTYTYFPPNANLITFEQEKITTLQLTVLSGMGNTELKLTAIKLEDWKIDKANVGDLIPQ